MLDVPRECVPYYLPSLAVSEVVFHHSGIDSFAFDLQNPRPYDVVMPIVHDTKIPKSISCDDKLLYRATRDTAVAGEELTEIAPLAAPDIPSQSEQPKMVQTAHWTSHGGTSTHNERARQRMERVRLATMKREQARLEEQNRKEVARITRKLIAEQEQREAAMVSLITLSSQCGANLDQS